MTKVIEAVENQVKLQKELQATGLSISRTSGTQSARIEILIIKVKNSSIEENLKNEIIKELEYIDMLNERQFAETQQVLFGI